ncbi:MAG: thioesterase family protein [Polyangiales bacterium]
MSSAIETIVRAHHVVRGIETDATATVSPGWLSRMLEAARWEVFGRETFVLRNRIVGGVARAASFDYGVALRYQDEIEIATWLGRVGRTSYDFGHAVTRVQDSAVAARARVTVVHIGPDGPAPLDEDLSTAVLDEPLPEPVAWSDVPRESSWKRSWVVRPSDQDSFRHVNQARYVDFADDTRQLAALSQQDAGLVGPLASLSIEYLRETHAGSTVQMETWVTGDHARGFELTNPSTGVVHSRGQVRGKPDS